MNSFPAVIRTWAAQKITKIIKSISAAYSNYIPAIAETSLCNLVYLFLTGHDLPYGYKRYLIARD